MNDQPHQQSFVVGFISQTLQIGAVVISTAGYPIATLLL